ncbi:hypothetical protein U9M48_019115 [Paspalum notatum var. saurae]|uniref:Aspartic peptidase DDI1-type domain-containing protein n=1 Tax=Paspalum notatum var. saurae TaxID=547442 RepID=A0AAQ3TDA0_PASNO
MEAPKSAPHEFYDTTVLPFPQRCLRMLNSKYLKDILNNKKPLPSIEVVHLTEECIAAILNQLSKKKKDPGNPSISCSIGTQNFDQALYDLGASVSVMPKVDTKTPLILGRPFLSTAEANIDVGAREVHLNINGRRDTFAFKRKVEHCRLLFILQDVVVFQESEEGPEQHKEGSATEVPVFIGRAFKPFAKRKL